jgi:hypothetical protein
MKLVTVRLPSLPKYRRSEIPSKSIREFSTTRKCEFPSSTVMNDIFGEQNAETSIFRTCAGIRMDLSDEHSEKASPSISCNAEPDSNDTVESERHPRKHSLQRISTAA